MKTLAILLGLVLVLSLTLWVGTATAGTALEKWGYGPRETISVETGRGGMAAPDYRIGTAPEKFDVYHRGVTPTRELVPCRLEEGMGGKVVRMDLGEKWVF